MSQQNSVQGKFPKPQTPASYTPKEAALLAGITGKALRRAIRKGKLEASKVSGRWYISSKTLSKYLASREVKSEEEEATTSDN